MKHLITENISNPEILEKLYRENKEEFSRSFEEISKESDSDLIKYWKIRLNSEILVQRKEVLKKDLKIVILLSVLSGILVKIPDLFLIPDIGAFMSRNLALIVFNGLIFYTMWQNNLFSKKSIMLYGSVMLILTVFLNLLPTQKSDSSLLSFIHAPLLLWCLFGFAFISFDYRKIVNLIDFIRFNGELVIMTNLLFIAGGIFTGLTIGLFSAINMNIEKFYVNNILVIGGVAVPIISYYLIRIYPELTSKIAPVIARIFTPVVLLTMAIYLISFAFAKGLLLQNRQGLIFFNIMLLAVMALIVFSISELNKIKEKNKSVLLLFLLSALTCLTNLIALMAITGRVLQGLTPNRTVVFVSNILIFIHLILITRRLYESYFNKKPLARVDQTVSNYIPVYAVWTIIVIFFFPFVFGFK